MPSASELKIRINSIRETKKVTDAMYMISSVKMQRAKRENEKTRPYFNALREEIGELLENIPENRNRYFKNMDPEGIRGRAILLITADRGLSGAYNQTVIRAAEDRLKEHDDFLCFIVGEYGRQSFAAKKLPFVPDFSYAAQFPTIREAQRICTDLLRYYNSDRVDQIEIIYTHSTALGAGDVKRRILLPLERADFYGSEHPELNIGKEYYPDPDTVLSDIVPPYLTGFIYSALVDSYCSEQQARMSAMNTAGKNAEEMLKKLQIQYNGIRQAAITNEMIEITSGTKALKSRRKEKIPEAVS